MSTVIRRRVLVAGRVQGVGYRAACARQAVRVGVSGWVRNLHDGRVEAIFEGPSAAVEQLVTWCRRGPTMADVDDVQVHDETPTGETGFRTA